MTSKMFMLRLTCDTDEDTHTHTDGSTDKTKLKLDKEVGGEVLHECWKCGSVLFFGSLCVLNNLSILTLTPGQ